ncbi:MAG TPA: TIR domain-containing protein [Pyrinomonadaceae bacterium]|nr:TIR domain-containing protein [Pyrinomonadaceae bacterium]
MPEVKATRKPLKLFFSYAHEDESFRSELQVHLSGLKKRGIISDWYDGGITAGTEWSKEISRNLEASEIILLLISPDFINSEYCYDYEMKRALEKHEAGEARVIPVLIRNVDDWGSYPFARLQVVPRGAVPVENWEKQDDAWVDVARNIRLACQEMLEIQRASEIPETKEEAAAEAVAIRRRGNSVQLINPSAEVVGQLERIREISVDLPSGMAAGAQSGHLPDNRRETHERIDEALHVMRRAAEDGGRAVKDLHAGDVQVSRVDLLLKKAILLHAEAGEANLDTQLPEENRKALYEARLKEAYGLLREANQTDPTNTEVLLQMAQLLVELTPDDPADEQKLLNRIRKLLDEPKTDLEDFRLARATYMLAMSSKPPKVELLLAPRLIFEKLGRVEWVEQCDRVLEQVTAAAKESIDGERDDEDVRTEAIGTAMFVPKASVETSSDFQPAGPWQFQGNDPGGSIIQLDFHPDGSFEGSQTVTMQGTSTQLTGRWGYSPFNRLLQLQGMVAGHGQFAFGISIQGPQNKGFHGIGTDGYVYSITRGGGLRP